MRPVSPGTTSTPCSSGAGWRRMRFTRTSCSMSAIRSSGAWRVYKIAAEHGRRDRAFLERVFLKLLLNFNWWVNRKDVHGRHLFAGGFLGLDNIGVFDRSRPLPGGGTLEQADGTAWVAFF